MPRTRNAPEIFRLIRRSVLWRLAPAAALLAGCGESVYAPKPSLLPAHIRSATLRPFVNKTQYFGLEDKLLLRVSDEFLRDGRLIIVNNESEADGVLAGEIVRYIREPIAFDSTGAEEEIKLWVIIDLKFIDRVNRILLWEEPRLSHEYRYFVETRPGGETEEEARQRLWDLFARDIVRRTVEGFGSVSGASERKISNQPPPKPAPARPVQPPPSPY
ncbi:MAG: LPS assembly lipoprotein LptE [Elusimicrobiota bacterium]